MVSSNWNGSVVLYEGKRPWTWKQERFRGALRKNIRCNDGTSQVLEEVSR